MAISLRAVGSYVNGVADLTPVIPTGVASGDMMLCAYGTKPYNDAPTMNNGWVEIGSATDGTVAAGVDVGSMRTSIFNKIHTGSETNPTITNTTNNVSGAVIIVFQKAAGNSWATPVGSGGGDATAGTGFSVTAASNFGITANDMVVGYASIRSDAGTQSAIGITATGVTFGAFTESPTTDLATTAGGDMAMSGGYLLASSGTASAAAVYASTLAAAHTGSAYMVRLREVVNTTTTQTITGVSRIQKSVDSTITGVSRIQKTVTQTITGLSRIQQTVDRTITGVASIEVPAGVNKVQTGVARIQKEVNPTISGVSRIRASTTRTIAGVARIQNTISSTQTGLSRIQASNNITITGVANIILIQSRVIVGISNIFNPTAPTFSLNRMKIGIRIR